MKIPLLTRILVEDAVQAQLRHNRKHMSPKAVECLEGFLDLCKEETRKETELLANLAIQVAEFNASK